MFAENGHGALAGPPTAPDAPPLGLPRRPIPDIEAVEHELELNASRERLSQALLGQAMAGGTRWTYVVGRLLLALDHAAPFAQRQLATAAADDPSNGWYRLYAVIAQLRAGRFKAADSLWTPALGEFCRAERDAVLWIAEFEALRGWPQVELALRVMAARQLGWSLADLSPFDVEAEPARTCDARFTAVQCALGALQQAIDDPRRRAPEGLHDAVASVIAAAAPLVSEQAALALLDRWWLNWRQAGRIDEAAARWLAATIRSRCAPPGALAAIDLEPAGGFWGRPALAYQAFADASRPQLSGLSGAEQDDARAWIGVHAEFRAAQRQDQAEDVPVGTRSASPAGFARPKDRVARLGRLLR